MIFYSFLLVLSTFISFRSLRRSIRSAKRSWRDFSNGYAAECFAQIPSIRNLPSLRNRETATLHCWVLNLARKRQLKKSCYQVKCLWGSFWFFENNIFVWTSKYDRGNLRLTMTFWTLNFCSQPFSDRVRLGGRDAGTGAVGVQWKS